MCKIQVKPISCKMLCKINAIFLIFHDLRTHATFKRVTEVTILIATLKKTIIILNINMCNVSCKNNINLLIVLFQQNSLKIMFSER